MMRSAPALSRYGSYIWPAKSWTYGFGPLHPGKTPITLGEGKVKPTFGKTDNLHRSVEGGWRHNNLTCAVPTMGSYQ